MKLNLAEYLKMGSAFFIGVLTNIYNKYSTMLLFMFIAVIFDVITGLIKAKYTDEKITKEKGENGFCKKIIFFISYFFGIFMDFAIPYMLTLTGQEININCCFGWIIGAYITLNETISIIENIYDTNPDVFPAWIADIVRSIKDKIDKRSG